MLSLTVAWVPSHASARALKIARRRTMAELTEARTVPGTSDSMPLAVGRMPQCQGNLKYAEAGAMQRRVHPWGQRRVLGPPRASRRAWDCGHFGRAPSGQCARQGKHRASLSLRQMLWRSCRRRPAPGPGGPSDRPGGSLGGTQPEAGWHWQRPNGKSDSDWSPLVVEAQPDSEARAPSRRASLAVPGGTTFRCSEHHAEHTTTVLSAVSTPVGLGY
jgi:hypothetical protein